MKCVSVVIVTYNRLELLKECIEKASYNSQYIDNIFVVNNNSDDGTKEYLEQLDNHLVVPINLEENLGGAGGFSFGLKYAYEHSESDYFIVLDDDTMMRDSSIEKLLLAAKKIDNDFGFLCSDVRWYQNNLPSYLNVPVADQSWNEKIYDGLIKVKSASFVSFLVRREVIKDKGLPISEMFIWADDVEYSTRISSSYPCYYVSDSVVDHKCASNNTNGGIEDCPVHRIRYYKCMFRNRIYIYRKYYKSPFKYWHAMRYLCSVFSVIFHSKEYKMKRIQAIISGTLSGFVFNPKIKYPNKK